VLSYATASKFLIYFLALLPVGLSLSRLVYIRLHEQNTVLIKQLRYLRHGGLRRPCRSVGINLGLRRRVNEAVEPSN
jgi:hypothetical protein